jgi:hypothetical protein
VEIKTFVLAKDAPTNFQEYIDGCLKFLRKMCPMLRFEGLFRLKMEAQITYEQFLFKKFNLFRQFKIFVR